MKSYYLPSEIDYFAGTMFLQELQNANEGDEIIITFCYGGDIDMALKIANVIEDKKLNTYADYLVASAGVVVYSAGNKRTAEEYTQFMLHRSMYVDYYKQEANSTQLEADVEALKHYDELLATYIAGRCDVEQNRILDLMDANGGMGTWLNVEEAIELGLVNEIAEPATNKEKALIVAQLRRMNKMSEEQKLEEQANEEPVIEPASEPIPEPVPEPQDGTNQNTDELISAIRAELEAVRAELKELLKEATVIPKRGNLVKPEQFDKENKADGSGLRDWINKNIKL